MKESTRVSPSRLHTSVYEPLDEISLFDLIDVFVKHIRVWFVVLLLSVVMGGALFPIMPQKNSYYFYYQVPGYQTLNGYRLMADSKLISQRVLHLLEKSPFKWSQSRASNITISDQGNLTLSAIRSPTASQLKSYRALTSQLNALFASAIARLRGQVSGAVLVEKHLSQQTIGALSAFPLNVGQAKQNLSGFHFLGMDELSATRSSFLWMIATVFIGMMLGLMVILFLEFMQSYRQHRQLKSADGV